MNKEEFIKEVEKLGIKVTNEQLTKLDTYAKFLIEQTYQFNCNY